MKVYICLYSEHLGEKKPSPFLQLQDLLSNMSCFFSCWTLNHLKPTTAPKQRVPTHAVDRHSVTLIGFQVLPAEGLDEKNGDAKTSPSISIPHIQRSELVFFFSDLFDPKHRPLALMWTHLGALVDTTFLCAHQEEMRMVAMRVEVKTSDVTWAVCFRLPGCPKAYITQVIT